jgi:hypothetical protein
LWKYYSSDLNFRQRWGNGNNREEEIEIKITCRLDSLMLVFKINAIPGQAKLKDVDVL